LLATSTLEGGGRSCGSELWRRLARALILTRLRTRSISGSDARSFGVVQAGAALDRTPLERADPAFAADPAECGLPHSTSASAIRLDEDRRRGPGVTGKILSTNLRRGIPVNGCYRTRVIQLLARRFNFRQRRQKTCAAILRECPTCGGPGPATPLQMSSAGWIS
jgi:hypothetical protein